MKGVSENLPANRFTLYEGGVAKIKRPGSLLQECSIHELKRRQPNVERL
jgi:hypothetical protein